MPIISTPPSTGAPQKADLKPIGICLPTNSSIEMSNSSTTLATNRVTTSSANTNYYNSGSAQSSTTSTPIPVGALSVMVARFAADANSRQQTVILHPRPISSTNRAGLQMSGAIRASAVISGQTINTTGSTPSLTSSSASISVRTTHLISGQQHPTNALPVLNLSTVTNANTSGVSSHSSSGVKPAYGQTRPFISTSGPLPIESVSLVMANPNDSNIVNARPIRLHQTGNDLKQNTTIHSINKISGPRTTVMTGSALMATQPTKMAISIGGSGAQNANPVSAQHVARVGIIGQLPMSSGQTTTANKSGILNLPKGHFIINSPTATNLNSGNTTLHNMVNVSASVASFASSAQSSQTAKLSVNSSSNNIITNRHSVVSNSPFIQQNVSQHSQHSQQSHRTAVHQNANSNSLQTPSAQQSQQLMPPTTTVSTTSPLRPTILSSPVSSPVKQSQLQVSTPSSPRPSILIRKRIANDSHSGLTPTALFKTSAPNTTITASTTPLRASTFGLKTNDLLGSQSNADHRVNDSLAPTDSQMASNCASLPTTPNSEGNQTPRKKPRKQLLEPTSLKSSQNLHLLNSSANHSKPIVSTEREGCIRLNKKPRVSLLSSYSMGWKSLQYHFLRYSDVKPKPEKKLTLSELSNEGLQRRNGWKIHHLATQMEVMTDNEESVHQRLNHFLDTFERDVSSLSTANSPNSSACETTGRTTGANDSSLDSIADKLNDLIRGNVQRSNLFSDQISEARQLIIKLTTDHKERVGKITKKCANKRTYITK